MTSVQTHQPMMNTLLSDYKEGKQTAPSFNPWLREKGSEERGAPHACLLPESVCLSTAVKSCFDSGLCFLQPDNADWQLFRTSLPPPCQLSAPDWAYSADSATQRTPPYIQPGDSDKSLPRLPVVKGYEATGGDRELGSFRAPLSLWEECEMENPIRKVY